MKRLALAIALISSAALLSGCIIVPHRHGHHRGHGHGHHYQGYSQGGYSGSAYIHTGPRR